MFDFSKVNFPFHTVGDSGQPKFHDSQTEFGILVPKTAEMHSPLSRGGHLPGGRCLQLLEKNSQRRNHTAKEKEYNILKHFKNVLQSLTTKCEERTVPKIGQKENAD